MPLFIVVYLERETFIVVLFRGTTHVGYQRKPKAASSALLTVMIDGLLSEHALTLADLAFIAAGRGPGPFTTIRTLLACLHGISMGSGVPLVGLSSLDVLLHTYQPTVERPLTIALINAFQREMYVAAQVYGTHQKRIGYCGVPELLSTLKHHYPDTSFTVCGDGALLIQEEIRSTFGHYAHIPDEKPTSLQILAHLALDEWNANRMVTEIAPLYLRDQSNRFTLD